MMVLLATVFIIFPAILTLVALSMFAAMYSHTHR